VRSACQPRLRSDLSTVTMEVNVNLAGSKQSLNNGDVTVATDNKPDRISIRL